MRGEFRPTFSVLVRNVVAAIALMLLTYPLRANTIVPGQTGVTPDVFTLSGMPPVLNDATGNFTLTVGTGTITGTYEDVVLVDPFGVTCAGCLDFAMQIIVNSAPAGAGITSVYSAGFFDNLLNTPYATDVGYATGTGKVAPSSVNYGPAGVVMQFVLPSPLTAGESTDFLVVATNATSYNAEDITAAQAGSGSAALDLAGTLGGISTQGGIGQPSNTGDFFIPKGTPVPSPEPSILVLTGMGLFVLMGMAFFRKQQA